jgi:hypothetical protein
MTFAIQTHGSVGVLVRLGHGLWSLLLPVRLESNSQRSPRLSVKFGRSRQSSCGRRWLATIEGRRKCLDIAVALKDKCGPVEGVRSGPRDDIEDAVARTANFCSEARGRNLELANRILRQIGEHAPDNFVIVVATVHRNIAAAAIEWTSRLSSTVWLSFISTVVREDLAITEIASRKPLPGSAMCDKLCSVPTQRRELGLVSAMAVHAHLANLMPFTVRRPGADALLPAIAGGAVGAFFSFGGRWEASKIAGEVRNPKRTLPMAFIGGVTLVTVVYLMISAAFLAVLPIGNIESNTAFVAPFGGVLFGHAGTRVLSACVCGGIAALTMAAPRVCYAMAEAGSFFPVFGKLHPRLGTPANAILLQTGLALAVLYLGAFDRVLAYIIFSAVLFLALAASTLFRMETPVRGWWFPIAPVVFITLCGLMALLILMRDPLPALAGVVCVLFGWPLRRFLSPRAHNTTARFRRELVEDHGTYQPS